MDEPSKEKEKEESITWVRRDITQEFVGWKDFLGKIIKERQNTKIGKINVDDYDTVQQCIYADKNFPNLPPFVFINGIKTKWTIEKAESTIWFQGVISLVEKFDKEMSELSQQEFEEWRLKRKEKLKKILESNDLGFKPPIRINSEEYINLMVLWLFICGRKRGDTRMNKGILEIEKTMKNAGFKKLPNLSKMKESYALQPLYKDKPITALIFTNPTCFQWPEGFVLGKFKELVFKGSMDHDLTLVVQVH